MPWRKYATDWIAALTGQQKASNVGAEVESGYLVVQVEKPIADGVVKVELPCGQKVTGKPAWSRQASESETLVAFDSESLGVEGRELKGLAQAPETRRSRRVATRLWVSFPEEPQRGTVTTDLSLEGCKLLGDFRDREGQEVSLYLDLYDSCEPLRAKAKVVWADSSEAGLRFMNLHVADEVRLLKNLGRATAVAPSNFLPSLQGLSSPYTYQVQNNGEFTSLSMSVTNWDVKFEFDHALVRGAPRGSFSRFQLLQSSSDIQDIRARLGLNLKKRHNLVHLVLMDDIGDVVFEVVGEEVAFQRVQRSRGAYSGEEVSFERVERSNRVYLGEEVASHIDVAAC